MPPSPAIRILHLEDSARDAELIRRQLNTGEAAYDILQVDTGPQFEAALAASHFDLILLDYNVPNYYGRSAVRLARQQQPGVPIVIVSGLMDEEEAVACLRLGATDYILKGRLTRLGPAVRRALDEAEEHRRNLQAEMALRESEAQLRQAQAVAQLGSWTFDVAQQLFICSAETVRIFGLPEKAAFLFEEFLPQVHPDDRKYLEQSWKASLTGKTPYDLVYRLVSSEGERWVHDRAEPTRDNTGRVVRLVGITQDITERERDRNAVLASEQFIRATLSALPDRIAVLDETGRLLRTNRAWQEFVEQSGLVFASVDEGVSYLEVCEQGAAQGVEGATRIADLVRKLLSGECTAGSAEYAIQFAHEQRWFLCQGARFQNSGQTRLVLSHTNITARRQAEEALRRLNDELEETVKTRTAELERANRAKSDFLAAMSHEIRTPMNGVIGMIDVLHQSSLKGDQVEMVDLIRESANSLLAIIEDVLDYSKIEAGRLDLEHAPVWVGECVQRVCVMLDRMAEKSGVDLTLFIDPMIPAQALGDSGRLRQVLINLINNAIKFSRGQARRGRVAVRVLLAETTAALATVEFRVTDNGIGMDAETLGRLFTSFTQADVSTTRRFGGTGLGLAISRRLVELMGGQITARSEPGAGSTFTTRIPFVPLPSAADGVGEVPSAVAGLSCVVVGETDGMGDDLAAYLTHAAARVIRERDLASAREHAATFPPGLLVWVIDTGERQLAPEALLAQTQIRQDVDARLVIVAIERGRRRKPRRIGPQLILVDGNVLSCGTFLAAVAMAAGRLLLEPEDTVTRQDAAIITLRTREAAIQRGQLILVAEDNETNRTVILRQLQALGCTADIVSNGREALQRWEHSRYALVLTDLHMPEMDGYQLTVAIRAAEAGSRHTPIVALTANALKGEADRCRAIGMDEYVTKPLPLADLKGILDRWLPEAGPVPDPATAGARSSLPEASVESPVDISVLKGIVGDDAAILREVLQDFMTSAARIGAELRAACTAGQAMVAAAGMHKLKSSARAVGALALGELCAELEAAGRAGDSASLNEQLPLFEGTLAAVQASLSRLLARELGLQSP